MERVQKISSQILPNLTGSRASENVFGKTKNKLEWFKDKGWGFKDTEFLVGSDGVVSLTGKRYQFSGEKMPKFRQWAENTCHINLNNKTPKQNEIPVNPSILNQPFLDEIKGKVDEISFDGRVRIIHSHGHTLQEVFALRHGKFDRTVDVVVFIASHEQAELVVTLANKHNVVLIPYGGGTNVTQSLMCPQTEQRMIVSVDVNRMNHVKWVDRKNMTACIEVGIIGQDLQVQLARYGVTMGHQPDSVEFSTLGGWISTRASGMKKNKYGNIEDILINVKIVTSLGTFTKLQDAPRMSSGPDVNEFILGSEGTLGIITEAIVKVKPLPAKVLFDSIIFHNFQEGTLFMNDVANSKQWPASIRLVDNNQFVFGMSLKTENKSQTHEIVDQAKKFLVTQVLKFDPAKMCLCTILYEGTPEEVHMQQTKVNALSKQYKGFRAGPENGERGYFLTFVIAYIRDFAFEYGFVAESFQTSCPWNQVTQLCQNSAQRIEDECQKHGVKQAPFISFRVTQVYDTGAAIYVYFGFVYFGLENPVQAYEAIEDAAREEVMKNGGCISHHHGVGQLRKKFMENSVGKIGIEMIKSVKRKLDPNNIFASGNLTDFN